MSNFRQLIDEMKMMLNDNPSLTLTDFITETFILPEGFDDGMGQPSAPSQAPQPTPTQPVNQQTNNNNEQIPVENKISGIEKELTDIRKISLNVITRLADQPSSEQYQLMKKIWNTVDKAIENGNNGGSTEA